MRSQVGNDHQLKKILIVKQILFVSTFKMYGEQYGEFKGAEGWNYIYTLPSAGPSLVNSVLHLQVNLFSVMYHLF